jgi:hypothetical protein
MQHDCQLNRQMCDNVHMNVDSFVRSFAASAASALRDVLEVFVASAETCSSNQRSDNAARGGRLNYRSGELDDGTDPTGWYSND